MAELLNTDDWLLVSITLSRSVFAASTARLAVVAAAIRAGADFDPVVAENQVEFAPPRHRLAHILYDFT